LGKPFTKRKKKKNPLKKFCKVPKKKEKPQERKGFGLKEAFLGEGEKP